MASAASKRARAGEDGGSENEAVAVADGFEAPLFGARVVGQVTTLPLEGEDGPLAALEVNGVVSDRAGDWYVTTADSVLHVSAAGRVRSVATLEGAGLRGIAISPDGSALFVVDMFNDKIRRVEVATGAVTTLAGSGETGSADDVGGTAQFSCPYDVAISRDGTALFVADLDNHKIRRVEVATGAVTTVAGSTAGSADGWPAQRSSTTQAASPSARTEARCLWRTTSATRSGGSR